MSVVLVLRQGDEVKAGQVLGFIEQLGTFMPVEVSPCAEAMFCLSCNIASAICHLQSMASRQGAGKSLFPQMQGGHKDRPCTQDICMSMWIRMCRRPRQEK